MLSTSWWKWCVAMIGLLCSVMTFAQTESKQAEDPARQKAFQVYDSGKYVQAMTLLENYVGEHPDDLVAKERWAYSVLQYASTLPKAEDRKKALARLVQHYGEEKAEAIYGGVQLASTVEAVWLCRDCIVLEEEERLANRG